MRRALSSLLSLPTQPSTRALSSSAPLTVYKKGGTRDVVYLYQFPRSPVVPNLSPFCLKLETYLRIKGIKYEAIGTLTKSSSTGLKPFIELNGEQIPDSEVIIKRLEKHFGCQDSVSPADAAVGRALNRMLDSSTLYAIQLERVVKNPGMLTARAVSGLPLPAFITNLMGRKLAQIMGKRMRGALGKMTDEQIRDTLRKDLRAIDAVIGDKRFLFGDTPTAVDCSVFGHVASTYFLPWRQTLSDELDDECSNLKKHMMRIKAHYYPEWK